MNLSFLNKKTYEDLAEEYEDRVQSLLPVTRQAMNYFARYIQPGGSVLDVGCGVGTAISVLTDMGFDVSGIDISPKMALFARTRNPNAKVTTGDFLEAEFPDKFDAVLAFAFIHLFPKAEAVKILDKMKNILRPGGVALISSTESPLSKEGWETKIDYSIKKERFRKFWTESEMREFLLDGGFEIQALQKYKDPYGKVWTDFVVSKK